MSHFTHMKTSFQNFEYLEKALNKLNIPNKRIQKLNAKNMNLVIPQLNNHDLEFVWNNDEYELILDLMLWKHPYPIESFINLILEQYAKEVIIGETNKIGFQPVELKQNIDGSQTIKLERWNN